MVFYVCQGYGVNLSAPSLHLYKIELNWCNNSFTFAFTVHWSGKSIIVVSGGITTNFIGCFSCPPRTFGLRQNSFVVCTRWIW